jgi:hypothetical protein
MYQVNADVVREAVLAVAHAEYRLRQAWASADSETFQVGPAAFAHAVLPCGKTMRQLWDAKQRAIGNLTGGVLGAAPAGFGRKRSRWLTASPSRAPRSARRRSTARSATFWHSVKDQRGARRMAALPTCLGGVALRQARRGMTPAASPAQAFPDRCPAKMKRGPSAMCGS